MNISPSAVRDGHNLSGNPTLAFALPLVLSMLSSIYPATIDAGGAATIGFGTGETAIEQLDHQPWDALLKRYVDDRGVVDYQAWHSSADDRRALQDYLDDLSKVDLRSATRRERLAFWINAYNALTIEGILREYPTDSIRNHTAKFFGYNIWDDLKLKVQGEAVSLNHIEHEVLRPMKEPRIHFAIVCASKGCPPLRNEAYWPADIDGQLERNAKVFFGQRMNFELQGNRVVLSSILDWFGEDFASDQTSLLKMIGDRGWVDESVASKLRQPNLKITFRDYDWSLNGQ